MCREGPRHMTTETPNSTVVGVDVGGFAKGFHAVALRDGRFLDRLAERNADTIADWCRKVGARAVAIDAPCRWSAEGHARRAERDLMRRGIRLFSTPTSVRADSKASHSWILRGKQLYESLRFTHRLFDG